MNFVYTIDPDSLIWIALVIDGRDETNMHRKLEPVEGASCKGHQTFYSRGKGEVGRQNRTSSAMPFHYSVGENPTTPKMVCCSMRPRANETVNFRVSIVEHACMHVYICPLTYTRTR